MQKDNLFLVLRRKELKDVTKFGLEFNVKLKNWKGYLTQAVLKPLCARENQVSETSYPVHIYHISHIFLYTHGNLERNKAVWASLPFIPLNQRCLFTCTAHAFPNTNVKLSLGFLWSLSNAAFTDGPQDCRDHGFDTSCLFNGNNKQPNKTKHPCPPKKHQPNRKKNPQPNKTTPNTYNQNQKNTVVVEKSTQ